MYFLAQLVVKSYIPHTLEKGMWFVKTLYYGDKLIFALDKTFLNKEEEEAFITENGYPVKPYIVEEYMDGSTPAILATPEEIGWLDEGEDTDELRDVTLEDINYIVNYEDGFLLIDIDGETGEPTLAEGKVIIAIPDDEEGEEELWEEIEEWDIEDECPNCGSTDIDYNSSGDMMCNNCGWEEGVEE